MAIVVDPAAGPLTSGCNMGDWTSGALVGANGTDPQWVTTARGDFHLSSTSNAVDKCSNDGKTDIEGWPRPVPVGGTWDVGAIEYH